MRFGTLGKIGAVALASFLSACAPISQSSPVAATEPSATRRLHVGRNPSAPVVIWTLDNTQGYLLGLDATGRQTLSAVDILAEGCFRPDNVRVDHLRKLWIACNILPTGSGGVQEYDATGTLLATYNQGCPSNVSGCSWVSSQGEDGAFDSAGHVFNALVSYKAYFGSKLTTGTGIEWWNVSSPSSPASLLALPSPVQSVDYLDFDRYGNLWFDYSGCSGSVCGLTGLGEITNPTSSSWQFVNALTPGSITGAGGAVYLSNAGTVLNVVDENARTISRYHVPVRPSSQPFVVLGPMLRNRFACGNPIGIGFNHRDTLVVAGDACGWLDLGNVRTNVFHIATNADMQNLTGAAYTPSDK